MPLQRLTMDTDYSERPINPLPQRSTRNPSSAVLASSSCPKEPAKYAFSLCNSPFRLQSRNPLPCHGSVLVGKGIQRRLPLFPGLKAKPTIRKFEEFSIDGDVAMYRGVPTPISILYPRRNMVPSNVYVNDLNFILPPRLISQEAGQQTAAAPNPEDDETSPTGNATVASLSSQLRNAPQSNAPVSNWRQAIVSSCVVGVALVAVATGYACSTVFRGALNIGQFIYTNRDSIQQTGTTCIQAVQSTYNAAKYRMVSIPLPRLPVGMRRRYTVPPTPNARSWRRRLLRQSRIPVQSPVQPSAPISPVATSLASEGMPDVEYSGLSNAGGFPDTQDAADPDAFILPRSSDLLASGASCMTGGLFFEPTPPPPASSSVPDQLASKILAGYPTPDGMEPNEQPWGCYAESVSSEDIEDEYVAEDGDDKRVPTAELFKDDGEHMELQEDFWSFPGQFEPRRQSETSHSLINPQAKPKCASPVFETAPPTAPAPVFEHASSSPPGSPVIEPGSPLQSPPGTFPLPPPTPTPSPSPPSKAAARQGEKKSRKRGGNKMTKNQKSPLPPTPPRKRKASSPPKEVRRSNRIADLNK